MSEELINLVNTRAVPLALMAIMFSLGLSLAPADFARLLQRPRATAVGLGGQLLLLPLIAWTLALLFDLPPAMAVGLIILAACPGGVTSNAVVFAARGDVALSVTLTACASLVTIISTPLLIGLGLDYFYAGGDAPTLDVGQTMARLLQMTVMPVALGMLLRHLRAELAITLIRYLRPVSVIILVLVIGFSVAISVDLLLENLRRAGPVIYALNLLAMAGGLLLARLARLGDDEGLTLAVEVGVQNATMATFFSLSVLNDWQLAIVPTMYGCVMLFNAGLMVRLLRWRHAMKRDVGVETP
ncbi:bile acid:sodium symporter family protein [Parahaliea mediterranea]|uniref:Bile acid:sodium symporter family protein n=1 Tax=Parahaliea mediterranea TaxID=651086 RepID=A0A939ILU6_9GAMM|nr:bile acid:sodium symporter [Parahaliea mediterranea]MBN7796353.1 bile acid:sodium symporter family protein [Parahaliea mediterranea]